MIIPDEEFNKDSNNTDNTEMNFLTDEQFNAIPGETKVSVPTITPKIEEGGGGFLERAKLSFGGEKSAERIKQIEEEQGTRGKFDIGDIADVLGDLIPIAAGVGGGFFGGGLPGAVIGTTGGEAAKIAIGKALGVREEIPLGKEAVEVGKTAAYTYLGGKALPYVAKLPGVKQAINMMTEKLPERLFSTFFKTTADDLEQQVRTGALKAMQKETPEVFDNMVKQGIIRIGKRGIEINPTLARQALERDFGTGKTGRSLEKMAEHSFKKQFEMELKARQLVKGFTDKIDLGKYKVAAEKMINDTYNTFKKEGYGIVPDIANEAKTLSKELAKVKSNKISAELALRTRRMIDSLRNLSSFRTDPKLTSKQAFFKDTADKVRGMLADNVPALRETMKEYKFYIDAADDLIGEAARRGNQRIFNLFDAFVGGSSIGAGVPFTGIGLLAALRTIQTPAVMSAIARGLYKSPELASKYLIPLLATYFGVNKPFEQTNQTEEIK